MQINPKELMILMNEVESEDPIDFAALPFSENTLRELVATNLCELSNKLKDFSPEDRFLTLLASTGKLVLENLVLNIKLLTRDDQAVGPDVEALLNRLRRPQARE
jgi:predicted Mrr-cat superfamily restriction endonuclease